MKSSSKTTLYAIRAGLAGLALATASPQLACGIFGSDDTPTTMRASDKVPAAQGTVRISDADNGNTGLSIRVQHLAPPSKIAPDATTYVVWIQPRNGTIQSVGAMSLDDDLEGSLDAVTPHKRFVVTVTPEPSAQVSGPSHEPVFTYDVEPD
jgi:hypothetical protein